jgi:hypothetical protein
LAAIGVLSNPQKFYSNQVPNGPLISPEDLDLRARVTILMMVNHLLLIAPVLVIGVWVNKSASVIRWLLITTMLFECGFIYDVYVGAGEAYFWDPSQWSPRMWSNIAIPAGLNLTRALTVFEVFGPLGSEKLKRS